MARAVSGNAVTAWVRRYPLAPRYQRGERIRLHTNDGVDLVAARLRGPEVAASCIVLIHGFTNWSRHPAIYAFARRLATRSHVIVPDLRGHGRSGGRCAMGATEHLDVAAAVAAAPAGLPVVTVGVSMGGVATLLHAGLHGGIVGTIAVSAPARWRDLTTWGAARVRRYVTTRPGRTALAVIARTRVAKMGLPDIEDAAHLVAAIAPAFTIVIHDPADHYFPAAHAEQLLGWARDPKELWWVPGAGHGVDMLTTELADRLSDAVDRLAGGRADASRL